MAFHNFPPILNNVNKIKILLYNTQYLLGIDGSILSYVLNFYRYIYCPHFVRKKITNKLAEIINKEKPDICCFIEMENNLIFEEFKKLMDDYPVYRIENKYGQRSLLRHLPFFKTKGNAFFAKNILGVKIHYLKYGTKKLVYEIHLPEDIFIFLAHFSLIAGTREKQFKEIKKMTADKNKVIICGDFNIFGGLSELDHLVSGGDLKIINSPHDKTFPSYKPKNVLDIFICSKSIDVAELRVLTDVKISDHLPVILEINT